MRILTVALLLVASSCFASDPPSPLDPGKEWSGPTYEKTPENKYNEEIWSYRIAGVANLIITKHLCSTCKPMGQELANQKNKVWPNDFSVLVDAGKHPGMITLSIEPQHHIAFSYLLTTGKHSYRVQLVMLDGIPARESMRLQQEVLRMVSGWAPE